jgi:cell division protein FtsW (lipid II flippase)
MKDDRRQPSLPPAAVLRYEAADRRPQQPSREQRTTATLVGFLLGFGVSASCAATWWLANSNMSPPATQPAPPPSFVWREPAMLTLAGIAILAAAAMVPVRARRDLRIAILTGCGLVLFLSGVCLLASLRR